jgi:hypothetical protein
VREGVTSLRERRAPDFRGAHPAGGGAAGSHPSGHADSTGRDGSGGDPV